MKWSYKIGELPDYMGGVGLVEMFKGNARDLAEQRRDPESPLRKRDLLRGGNMLQVGGEFLFENGKIIWCHRMRDVRGREC